MSLNSYKHQLIREAKKNPKQAAALGSLLVVALWFWAPLVMDWIPKGKDKEATAAAIKPAKPAPPFAKQNIGSDGPGQAAATAETPETHKIEWDQLQEWIESDPHTSSAELPTQLRDPFQAHLERSLAQQEQEAEEKEKAEPVQPRVTPKTLGLTLTSTIVGSRRRVAMISGKVYREGKVIIVMAGGGRIEFLLAEVGQRHVVLIRDEQRYELKIQPTTLAGAPGVKSPLSEEE